MSDQPPAPADPVAAEDTTYLAIASEYLGLRRAGLGILAAAAITGAHLVYLGQTAEA